MGTSVGKQGVPEKEKDPSVSKPDDKDTEESVLPSSIKIESTNKINVSQQEEHSSKLEDKEENSTESILTEKSKVPESDSLPSEDNNTINEISVEKKELVKSTNESEKEQSLVNSILPEQIVLSKEKEAVSSKQEEICSPASEDILIRPGLLKVIVFEASELVNKDMIGKSDPFVKIKFNGQEFKSQKVRNSLNPEWNFSTNLTVKSSDVDSDIVLEVYDDDFGSANFIGSYTFSLQQAITDTDKEATWNNLVGCKTGKISFSTIYIPDEESETKSQKDEIKVDDINDDKLCDNKSDEELSVEKEETGDIAPDSFINDIYTSEGKQSVFKQVSEATDKKEKSKEDQMRADTNEDVSEKAVNGDSKEDKIPQEKGQKEKSMNGHTDENLEKSDSPKQTEDTENTQKDVSDSTQKPEDQHKADDSSKKKEGVLFDQKDGKEINEEHLPSEKIQEGADPSEDFESLKEKKIISAKAIETHASVQKPEDKPICDTDTSEKNESSKQIEESASKKEEVASNYAQEGDNSPSVTHSSEKNLSNKPTEATTSTPDQLSTGIDTTENSVSTTQIEAISAKKSESNTSDDNLLAEEKSNTEIEKEQKSANLSENEESSPVSNDMLLKPGLIKVIVFEASELVNKDMIGKSDPFVKIKFNDQEYKSKKVRNCLNPEWNFSANLAVKSSNEKDDIVIEIYDDEFGSENFIGSYTLSLKQAVMDTDKEATWHNLSGCKTGKISYSTIYSADEEPEIKSENDAKEDDNSSSKKDSELDETDKNVNKDGDKKDELPSFNEKKDDAPLKEEDQVTPIKVESDVSSSNQSKLEQINLQTESSLDSVASKVASSIEDDKKNKSKIVENEEPATNNENVTKEESEKPRTGALGLKDAMKQVETSPLAVNKPDEFTKETKTPDVENSLIREKALNTLDQDSTDKKLTDNKEEKQISQNIDSESKQEKVEIESIGEIFDINESEDQKTCPSSDSFINETNTSLEKQNSSQIDEKSSIEKDIDEGIAPEASIKNIHTSSEKENSSHIDEELSVEKEETGDTAPDSFINDIYTSQGKQAVPEQESEVSEFKSGALKIIVHKAAELVNQDRFGKSDPYVIVKYRDKEFRSKTINNTLEPAWNFTSEFDIVEIDDSPIDIEVYDDDFGKDSSEGSYSLTLDEAINDLVVEGKWYNLEGCKTGKIFISTIYVSKDDEEHDEKDAQDESEVKEESGSSRVNEENEKLPTENDKINDNKETFSKSDTSGLGAVQVKDMFTLLKEIPHTHETDTCTDKPSKPDEIDIEAGILSLIIHKASQLENLDIVGKSDPFVKIKFNELEFKSVSVRNTLEPEWNFSNDLIISENQNKA